MTNEDREYIKQLRRDSKTKYEVAEKALGLEGVEKKSKEKISENCCYLSIRK